MLWIKWFHLSSTILADGCAIVVIVFCFVVDANKRWMLLHFRTFSAFYLFMLIFVFHMGLFMRLWPNHCHFSFLIHYVNKTNDRYTYKLSGVFFQICHKHLWKFIEYVSKSIEHEHGKFTSLRIFCEFSFPFRQNRHIIEFINI